MELRELWNYVNYVLMCNKCEAPTFRREWLFRNRYGLLRVQKVAETST